ncbi:three-Cys-motif partner protein TcmP [Rubrobacter indicoceani]|uniref:three-Cys-motif partner protein TcmP n=1 Tax=Rubrobacter indicoceani TaxID=2051957 RepID=UPI000E5B864D|nr:three-Cys-motif partner protein TcmP [Rubrobacter indicoceani]
MEHAFGGPWTEDKLRRVDKYLEAYMTIFTRNETASKLGTYYLDAFAGTGRIASAVAEDRVEGSLFEDALEDDDTNYLKEGSAYVALRQENQFDNYVFIDRSREHAASLDRLRHEFPDLADRITIEVADANDFLQKWCRNTNWKSNRAVVFLDPYGMQVDWATIEAIARTKAVDLWLLFPLGQAVNRLLTRKRLPEAAHAERLTRMFGTESWREAFYRTPEKESDALMLFDNEEAVLEKQANFDSIGAFFVKRLKTIFPGVAEKPLPLKNSTNVPLYLLCFAAANPVGAPTAVKIANHILKP